jgi:hypothetical protein
MKPKGTLSKVVTNMYPIVMEGYLPVILSKFIYDREVDKDFNYNMLGLKAIF